MHILTRYSMFALALLMMLAIQISTATAHQAYEVDVHFEELTLQADHDAIVVDYVIERDAWYRADRLGVTPQFHLNIPLEDRCDITIARDVEMSGQSGRIRLYNHHRFYRLATVHFEPVSEYRTSRVGNVRLKGDFAYTLEFSLHRGAQTYRGTEQQQDHHDPWAGRRGDDRSRTDDSRRDRRSERRRDRRTERRRDQRSERRDSRTQRRDHRSDRRDRRSERRRHRRDRRHERRSTDMRAEIVAACGEQTSFNSDREFCTDTAPDYKFYDIIETINACGETTSFSSHFQSCLHTVVDFKAPASSTIRACGDATSHGSHFVECLEAAADYDRDASRIVDACGESTSFSSRVADCVYDAVQ